VFTVDARKAPPSWKSTVLARLVSLINVTVPELGALVNVTVPVPDVPVSNETV
jgi:hypothetical protein